MSRTAPLLALVVPCYNEEETLPRTLDALADLLADLKKQERVHAESFALYVNDGSRDRTWELLEERHAIDPFCRAASFAANAGHQNAVWAGMVTARDMSVDCIISLDADLQDDIAAISEMIDRYMEGNDIVYGVRNDRSTDTPFKRRTAHMFYGFMCWLKVPLIPDHADYRLVARPVLEALDEIHEHSLFLRGIFPALGFKSAQVFYVRQCRMAGESKYPFWKMVSFAWKGITACSVAPLRIAGLMSMLCMLAALAFSGVSLLKYAMGETIQGWTSLIIVVLLLGSVQLFCMALVGEYLAKVFTEVRHRPRYIIAKKL
ncbi:glycosyltransferase family 2 protein [Desulfovibrio desulfuricans]|uniref:glycosyltransferase family 2 protein n=1 Tax=Desulfovibrio desulfuricans TaxID=876 RepID=UPI0035ADB0F9